MKDSFAFSEHVFGILIDSEIDQKKMEEISSHLEDKLKDNLFINLYVEDQHSNGISISGLLESISFHYTHSGSIKKVAIVTDLKWFQKTMELKSFLIGSDVQTFDISERMDAMNWVME